MSSQQVYEWLVRVVDRINNSKDAVDSGYPVDDMVDSLRENLHDFYKVNRKIIPYRMSNQGKPWLVKVLDDWLPVRDTKPTVSTAMRMVDGVWFEHWLTGVLVQYATQAGISVVPGVAVQHPKYSLVTGHIDLVLGNCLVVEVKALAKGLVNYIIDEHGMVKFDTFGYATQLCLYTHMTGLDSCFIMKDKSTGLLKIGVLDRNIMVNTLARFDAGMDKLSSIKRYDYKTLLESFTYPAPTPEIAQKRPTGRFYIPVEVRGIFWNTIFYQVLETTIKQTYICARPLDEVQKLLEALHNIVHVEGES